MNWRLRAESVGAGALLAALCGAAAPAWAGDWFADAGARLAYESNVNRAAWGGMVLDDFFFAPRIAAGQHFQLTGADRLTLAAEARGAVFGQYQGLNFIHGGGSFALRHKFGLGPFAPWITVHGAAGYSGFDSRLRDGGLYRAGLTLGHRLAPRLDLWFGYDFDYRDGPDPRAGW